MHANDIFQAWVEWRNQLQLRISLHQRMHVLICNHQIRSLRSCWNGWTLYVETKKRNNGTYYASYLLYYMYLYFSDVIYNYIAKIMHSNELLPIDT